MHHAKQACSVKDFPTDNLHVIYVLYSNFTCSCAFLRYFYYKQIYSLYRQSKESHSTLYMLDMQVGYNYFTFFEKVRSPFDGWKLISKTHLQKPLMVFLSGFVPAWLQSLEKVLLWPNNLFSHYYSKWVLKIRICHWFLIHWKLWKKVLEKVTGLGAFAHSTKRWKTKKIVHFCAYNFFCKNLFATQH